MSPLLYNIMMVLCFFTTCLLIGIILMQQSKSGGGLGFISGGGATESFLGANASSILVKITTVLAIIFLALCLIMATGAGDVAKAYSGSVADDLASETPTMEAPKSNEASSEKTEDRSKNSSSEVEKQSESTSKEENLPSESNPEK